MLFVSMLHADGLRYVRDNFEMGHNAEAIVAFERLDEDMKKQADARFLYATALAKDGRIESATVIFEELVVENPKIPEYYNNLAVLYSRQNRFADAQKVLEKGLATHKSYQTITENLRRLFQEQSRLSYAKALEVENQPIQLTMLNSVERTTLPVISIKPGHEPFDKETTVVAQLHEPQNTYQSHKQPQQVTEIIPVTTPQIVASAPVRMEEDQVRTQEKKPGRIQPIDEVLVRLNDWKDSWMSKDINKYFNAYSKEFVSVRWPERHVWISERSKRIRKPLVIEISLDNIILIKLPNGNYRVDFDMAYRSDFYKDHTRKRIIFKQEAGDWKIFREVALKAY
jgi:tetratricopeptide (TPR) repeat protein